MAKIMWRHGMVHPAIVSVKGKPSGVPKKPVIWIGEIWFTVPHGGKMETDTRSWCANKPMTRQDAQAVLHQLHTQLVNEHGKETATDSGFWMQSR